MSTNIKKDPELLRDFVKSMKEHEEIIRENLGYYPTYVQQLVETGVINAYVLETMNDYAGIVDEINQSFTATFETVEIAVQKMIDTTEEAMTEINEGFMKMLAEDPRTYIKG